MKMQNTYKGYWCITEGKTKILVYPGSDRPYKPVTFIYDDGPTYISRVGLLSIKKAVESFYTEEQLFEYFYNIAQ